MPIDACRPYFYDENMQVDSDGWMGAISDNVTL